LIILDASAWVSSLADAGPMGDSCRYVMVQDKRWTAPSHAATEALTTIWRYELAGLVSAEAASAMAAKVADAPIRYVGPNPALLRSQWKLRHNVSAYDAAYVVLAREFGAPLLTTDGSLARAAEALGVEVRHVRRN
jgi:predicted nucleic acid-binding protein